MKKILLYISIALLSSSGFGSCTKNSFDNQVLTETDPGIFEPKPFDINNINDTYGQIASYAFSGQWGSYNLHDPSIMKDGEWYYCFSTDVAYGQALKPGIMVRRSKDLVNWEFRGRAIDGLPAQAVSYIKGVNNTFIPNQGIWAPYIMKVGGEFRLYYSLASNGFRVSAIGLLTSSSLEGPWTEKGLAVTSKTEGPGTNAIDPSVVITPSGEHYMYYGSAWDGLFVVKLNPTTGLAATTGDLGTRIVRRGKTNNVYNGNLEGPEIIYNAIQQKYYLFVSYDWIDTKYNVRVFRSNSPTGPFVDWNGENADTQSDHADQIVIGPYAFKGHAGWQGTAHCAVFKNEQGQYFMATQGRPAANKFYMDMHLRKMFWAENGWPMVSPERFANVSQTPITRDELVGEYEQVIHGYVRVPGYSDTQTNPNINFALPNNPMLHANGTIFGDPNNTWFFDAATSRLEMRWVGGLFVDKLFVSRERDWENKVVSTIVMSGYNGGGLGLWFKKVK
ncbi:MAG TPA: arabinan endo-1,5-alpha-L-arabinosidase [Niabella sp.]|nr:arabinan endo-1,5-alpha-L-arabinosidase [Niabella sp.]HOZ97867.1 arabinan endo-1,5-alpha-L-arabinosidase [Niabella sp.]HQW13726.1 arabinan endo-1,5-alpha-L-arabinosidase [Niabella sp.]HQX19121.1 arabinan endo-1,5-alpha-L-arabinosidase [Niabella sp.]HQX41283.1 arabinan endo-1,5-alpha-L-arabinosidase [Niabella sp.]